MKVRSRRTKQEESAESKVNGKVKRKQIKSWILQDMARLERAAAKWPAWKKNNLAERFQARELARDYESKVGTCTISDVS